MSDMPLQADTEGPRESGIILEIRAEHRLLEERLSQLIQSLLTPSAQAASLRGIGTDPNSVKKGEDPSYSPQGEDDEESIVSGVCQDMDAEPEAKVVPKASIALFLSEASKLPHASSASFDAEFVKSQKEHDNMKNLHARGGVFRDLDQAAKPLVETSHFQSFVDAYSSQLPSMPVSEFAYITDRTPKMHWPCMRRIVRSSTFNWLVGSAIVLNALLVAVDSHVKLEDSMGNYDLRLAGLPEKTKGEEWINYLNILLCVFFTLELFLRFLAEGFFMWIGEDWRWNCFDTFIVVSSLLSFMNAENMNMSFGRLLRLVRLSRAMRTVRVLKYFQQTRIMLMAVLNSLVPLMWSVFFVLLVMFLFGIFMMGAVTEIMDKQLATPEGTVTATQADTLKTFFPTFPMTMLSLFMCVSGGKDWWDIGQVFVEDSFLYSLGFILYVSLMILGLLNIINGVFVAAASDMSRMDRETATMDEQAKRMQYVKSLRKVFVEFDDDHSGTLSWDEFQIHLEDPYVQAYFAALEINVSRALSLFKLLDVDGSGSVTVDEFIMGCMRLKGGAKTLDVGTLMYETRSLKHLIMKERELTTRTMVELGHALDDVVISLNRQEDASNARQLRGNASPPSPKRTPATWQSPRSL